VTDTGKRRLAKVLFALVLVEFAIGVVLAVMLAALPGYGLADALALGDLAFALGVLLFPVLGVVLATRRPDNAIGWLMLAIGLVAMEPLTPYGEYALASGAPGAAWALSAVSWTWVPVIGLAGTFVLLLFPDGHLPSPRWRWFAWAIAIGMIVTGLAMLLTPGTLEDVANGTIENRFGIAALEPFLNVAFVALATIPIGIIGSAYSLRVRYRASGPTERLQIRWLASAAAVVAVLYAFAMVFSLVSNAAGWGESGALGLVQNVAVLSFALIPVSIGIAVLKYRLYDIDVVIRKAVVVAAIALFFTAVYAAVVGGIGALVQTHSTTALSFVAAAVVALLFQPVLARSRRLAARIVYGKRATPYEVLSEFSEHVAGTYADEDVLPRMARVVGEGVGAVTSRVWLEREGRLWVAASWPQDADPVESQPLTGSELPPLPGADAAFAVEDRDELLGALAVAMPASDPIDEAKSKLVADLAAQAGLVLRNVRLTDELRRRLDDLKAAQKRLVTAQDEERRRIERNIHDGAQQQLVALSVRLRLAQALVGKDPDGAAAMLGELQGDATTALEDLRDLARGIYPPLLADQGLPAALQAQARKSVVPLEVSTDGVTRYAPEVEAAAYFCVLEALQNVAKYARASRVDVRLARDDGRLVFEVADDGVGFDPASSGAGSGVQGMRDRLSALDGALEVRSAPGEGTVVVGRIPVSDREAP
jgi:signal transduction histidine kinase